MANEFIARKGLIVLSNGANITGSVDVSTSVTASAFKGNGAQITGVISSSYSTTSSLATNSIVTASGAGTTITFTKGDGSTFPVTITVGASSTASYVEYNNVANKPTLVSASSQIDHDATTNFVANEHIDHSTVNISAGSGLSGGGDITATRTLSLDTSSVHFLDGVKKELNTEGVFSSSAQVSYTGLSNIPSGIISSSTQVTANLPSGTVSSSLQFNSVTTPFTGSFTGSFIGNGSGLINVTAANVDYANITNKPTLVSASSQIDHDQTTNFVANEHIDHSTVNITAGSGLSGGGDITATRTLTLDTSSAHFTGGVKSKLNADGVFSSSVQVQYGSITGVPVGIVSSSTQVDVRNTTGIATIATTGSNTFTGVQTISNTTNSTAFNNGALIVQGGVGIAKDVNISGSLTVTGILTAVTTSFQYVTSSQANIGVSRIVLNDDDNVRFAGLSVVDSGSTAGTGSLLWDSLKNHWIYQADDQAYNSAVIIAGPKNYGTLGDEEELIAGRVPVATGGDHIDTNLASSSIYIDFSNRRTYIEAGLYVTGAITASAGFSGNGSGLTNVAATSVPYSGITGLPTLVSASSQIDHDATTNFVANEHVDHSTVNITAGAGLLGGGDITTTRTLSVNSGSMLPYYSSSIFSTVSGDITINSEGVASIAANSVALGTDTTGNYASAVTAGDGITVTGTAGEGISFGVALNTGSSHFTGGVVKALPTGTVSSSLQFNSLSSPFTGSFTGSFIGDGSGLTGIATTFAFTGSNDNVNTASSVNLKTQGLIVSASEGIDVSVSGQTLTISGEDASTTNKGIAVFNSANFSVTSGQVTASAITFNGTPISLGGTYAFGLQNITPSGASTTDQVTLNGGAIIHGVLFTSASVTSIGGPVSNQVIATIPVASYDSAHFDYVIKDGTNFRTGTVMAVWDGTNVEFTDTSTNDIGNTLDEIFTVDISGGNARLKFTSGTGTWTVKTAVRAL